MLGQGLSKTFCECVCDKVMELLFTSYILFFVLVHLLLFLAFFIFYVCGIPLKVNIYCEKNADWIYKHSYRLGQIFIKGFKIARRMWGYWEKVWHYFMWLDMMENILLIPNAASYGLLIEYLWRVTKSLSAVACGQLIEYLWRV